MSSSFEGSYGATEAQTVKEFAVSTAKHFECDIEVWSTNDKGTRMFCFPTVDTTKHNRYVWNDGTIEIYPLFTYVYGGSRVFRGERSLYTTTKFALDDTMTSQPTKKKLLYIAYRVGDAIYISNDPKNTTIISKEVVAAL